MGQQPAPPASAQQEGGQSPKFLYGSGTSLETAIESLGAAVTDALVETLDLFPTLCELTGVPLPGFVDGVSLQSLLNDPRGAGHTACAYHGKARTIRTDTHRLILHKDGFAELYDHRSPAAETRNIADENKPLVKRLTQQLRQRLD